jgi:protein-disulfide isomerase
MRRNLYLGGGFAVLSLALVGASCDKKSIANPSPGGGQETPGEQVDPAKTGGGGQAKKSQQSVDLSKLDEAQKKRFGSLIDKVQSPCGKAHSLKKSLDEDKACKRAVFAARYVARLVGLDFSDEEVAALYEGRYSSADPRTFALGKAPYLGVPGAKVVIVEFFDYGCPACKGASPLIDEIAAEYPSDVVVYFKHFPLSGHKDSVPAAMAAIAAQKQGKFKAMHAKLFAGQSDHSKNALLRYAKEIGLDLKRFEADMDDAATRQRVLDDRSEGEKAEIDGTPTFFINGRNYSDPLDFESVRDWIEEEIGVNR